ncbi:MAG: 30S ribosomal protein S24e [Methanobacteriaceae archaeon]
MEINIIDKKENKVLNRTEVKFECLYQGEATPKTLDVKSKLVAMLDSKKELTVIDSIQPNYGEGKAAAYAKVYDSLESLKSIETEHVLSKNKEEEVEEAEEDATEEAPAENDDAEAE